MERSRKRAGTEILLSQPGRRKSAQGGTPPMAGGPQHVIQIMATQTCFDLNAALENWRNELNEQPQLTPDNRRELEKHLADSMAELRQRGLNEEESFWLARRRIGQPQQVAEEFEKVEPGKIWRERVLWMAVALVGSYVFTTWNQLLESFWSRGA